MEVFEVDFAGKDNLTLPNQIGQSFVSLDYHFTSKCLYELFEGYVLFIIDIQLVEHFLEKFSYIFLIFIQSRFNQYLIIHDNTSQEKIVKQKDLNQKKDQEVHHANS